MLAKRHREAPCGEWMSHICLGIDPGDLARSLEGMVSSHLDRLQSLGLLRGRRMDVAIDMHLIRRWDRKHEAELVRSKSKGRTGTFERYVVAQCVRPGVQLALALLHMPALEDTADYVRRAITACRGTGAEIGTVMLDREFFSTDVIRTLEELGVGYLIPCVNTPNVVDAITEFSKGERPQVSGFRIAKSKNDYAEYTMIITERKRKSKRRRAGSCEEEPEERYIAFATNRPGIDVDRYAERWMIETGFRMVENERVRTRSRSVTVRTLCFLYSLVLYNARVLANAELTGNTLTLGGVYSQTHADRHEGDHADGDPSLEHGWRKAAARSALPLLRRCHMPRHQRRPAASAAVPTGPPAAVVSRKAARRQSRGRACLPTALQPVPHSVPARHFAPCGDRRWYAAPPHTQIAHDRAGRLTFWLRARGLPHILQPMPILDTSHF